MKRRTIVLASGAIGILVLLGLLRQVMAERNEIIQLPMDAVKTAVDHTLADRESEAAALQQADREFIEQSQLLRAHEVTRVALSEWSGLRDAETCIRAKAIEKKLIEWRGKTGQNLELILKQELGAHLLRVDEWHKATPGISGEAEAIEKSRAIRGDTEALLYLTDLIYANESVPFCQDSYAVQIARLSQVFTEVAARVDTTDQQMARLREEQMARAREVWETTGTAEPQPLPPAPVTAEPPTENPAPEVEAQEPSSGRTALGRLFYGDE